MMHKIFESYKGPSFGRAYNIIRLSGFDTETLKQIVVEELQMSAKWINFAGDNSNDNNNEKIRYYTERGSLDDI